ncbi:putative importin subunit [Trichinella pseudospiralis]
MSGKTCNQPQAKNITEEYHFHTGDRSCGGGVKVKIFHCQLHYSENQYTTTAEHTVLLHCDAVHDYPSISKLIQIFFTQFVIVTSSERPFSCLLKI